MLKFTTNLKKELNTQLQTIDFETDCIIEKSQKSNACVINALNCLKAFILEYSFKDEAEEIIFFKQIKPEMYSKNIFHTKVIEIESLRPTGSYEVQQDYLKEELGKITLFFNEHKEFYQYYRMKSIHHDDSYFTRCKNKKKRVDFDENFNTRHDYTVAKIIAYDQLEIYLKKEIEKISNFMENPSWVQLGYFDEKDLKWTDTKTALTILIYAMHAEGSVNNGNCDIKEIAEKFEKMFNISLGDSIYHIFFELKTRINPTKYLDDLKASFLKRLEEDE